MIYSFYLEGGSRDGEIVLNDSTQTDTLPSQSDAWIDFTLGGVVGLCFPIADAKAVDPASNQSESQADGAVGDRQIYQVVYRDEIAGTVIVRCRYVPWDDRIPPGIKQIVFSFEGGLRDGATETCPVDFPQTEPSCEVVRERYRLTQNGTIGRRFGLGSDAALAMLKSDGPNATRDTSAVLHIYEVANRTQNGADLLLNCRFIRSECRVA